MDEHSTSNVDDVYKLILGLHDSCRQHIGQAVTSTRGPIDEVLNLEADISVWLDVLDPLPESQQLRSAHRDFGLAFYAAMSGLYRQAFAGLRSFLEVTMGAAYLSAFEFQRRQWVNGKLDISWSSISSPESGFYSAAFVDEFCPEAKSDRSEMHEHLKIAYRRCSEYVHGNVATSQLLPAQIQFSSDVLSEWLRTASSILHTLLHVFMVRYYKDLPQEQRMQVEPLLEDNMSHLASVKSLLGIHVE